MKHSYLTKYATALGVLLTISTANSQIRFHNPQTLPQPRGYSHVVEIPQGYRTFQISGQIPIDSIGQIVGKDDFYAQAIQVFENLRRALSAVGASFDNVVKLNFYVVDITKLAELRRARDQYVNVSQPPASTLVEVRRLAREEFLLEVDAVAALPSQ